MAKVNTAVYGSLALIPAQAQAPLQETLTWYTDILSSKNGKEEPTQFRFNPKQLFSYSVPIQFAEFAKTFNTVYGAVRQKWGIPVWPEVQYVGTIAAAATSITCTTTNFDFRDNSLAFAFNSRGEYQVLQIATVGSGVLNLSAPATAMTGAMLLPMRVGYLNGPGNFDGNANVTKLGLQFEVDDLQRVPEVVPAQYLGDDIYFDVGLLESGRITRSVVKEEKQLDFDIGPTVRRSPWTYTRYAFNFKTMTTTAAEMRAYKAFLTRRAGRYRRFWMPTFESNLRLVSVGNITTTITVESDNYTDYASQRTHVAFEDDTGAWYARAISNPTPIIGSRLQFTLSSALNIDASRIRRVSYLGLNRFDSDTVDINWIGNGVAESSVRVVELQP